MDCIEREAVISLIEERQKELCPAGLFSRHSVYGSDREKFDAWGEIIDAIQAISTVDPVKHARWIKNKDGSVKCSECDKRKRSYKNRLSFYAGFAFCPDCGAKMDL